jgi:hypothetical protein
MQLRSEFAGAGDPECSGGSMTDDSMVRGCTIDGFWGYADSCKVTAEFGSGGGEILKKGVVPLMRVPH